MPCALASSPNARFQVSKPAGPLPHWAASAVAPMPVSTAKAATIAIARSLPLVIQNLLLTLSSGSLADQAIAIFRFVEIPGLIEADGRDHFRGRKIGAVEIGADKRDAGQIGAAELGTFQRS